jgi:hypothetical protein
VLGRRDLAQSLARCRRKALSQLTEIATFTQDLTALAYDPKVKMEVRRYRVGPKLSRLYVDAAQLEQTARQLFEQRSPAACEVPNELRRELFGIPELAPHGTW